MTRARLMTAALVAAVVVWVVLALPRARLAPADGRGDDAVPGVVHVHSSRSDGRSSPEQIAVIAARAGLKFVVFTDHGDATRKPDPPTYRSGVLCIDAVEISTNDGHLVAMGLPVLPYPLTGDARDIIEDVHRFGGIGVAAHPDSPKADLRWRDWSVPLDGLEFLNLDTTWRRRFEQRGWRARTRLMTALVTYLFRSPETIAGLELDSPELGPQWSHQAAQRPTAIFAGADAHARLELRNSEPGDNLSSLPLPGYEVIFKTMTMRVQPEQPLTGEAAVDGRLVLDALRKGRAYSTVDAIMTPAAFDFSATAGTETLKSGDISTSGAPLTLAIQSNAPASFTTTVWRDDMALTSGPAVPQMTIAAPPGPAAYRVEIRASDRPAAPLWIVSNPIYVRSSAAATPPAGIQRPTPSSRPGRVLFDARTSASWRTEASPASRVALDIAKNLDGRALMLRYGLPGGEAFGEYAAAVVTIDDGLSAYDAIQVTARAEHPMRVSIQLRTQVPGRAADRWQRSIYVDDVDAPHVVRLDDFRPVGVTQSQQLPIGEVRDILFLIDRGNAKPGSSGRVWLSAVALQSRP